TNWGGVDVDQSYISTGFSNPTLYDSSGVYQLFVGSFSGNIYQFTNIDNNLNGQFTAVNSTSSNIWDGGKSALALADINNDNNPDMIVGNLSGGISFFSSDTLLTDTTITNVSNQTKNIDFTIYPNPAKTNFTIKSSETGIVTIKNLLGNTIYNKKKTEDVLKINISQFSKGIYVVLFKGLNKKLVVE
ncbi:MAG: T9SS type A sorting domain-containing protein, partial [Flavobacteriales bacterium]|nr:T9SS type A sorting domain-containing protein [Flavobacteriales bacterium]